MNSASTLDMARALRATHPAHAVLRLIAASLLLGLVGLLSACGSSSNSFVSLGTGTTSGATLTAISVEPANSSLPRGLTQQFTAMAIYSDGTKLDVSASVLWSSSNTPIATINATGLAAAVNLGATTITAAMGTVTGSATLTVTAATLVSIDVTPVSPTIAKGAQLPLTATGIYTDFSTQNLTTQVSWSSSNPLVATISNAPGAQGVVTAVGGGSATLTATLGAAAGSTALTVSGATLVALTVTPANAKIAKGLQRQFTATGVYSDGTQQNLTTVAAWSSSSPVATISNAAGTQGLATAAAVGVTTISAAAGGLTGSTTLTVTAASLLSITVTPTIPSIPVGLTQTFIATGTYSDGTTAPVTATAVWNSSVPTVASITNAPQTSGIATGLLAGNTVITATLGPVTSAPVTLTVTPAALVSIAVTPVNPTVVVGATVQFIATGTYTDGTTHVITGTVTWNSATPAIATIGNAAGPRSTQGLASAAAAGSTLITATFPGAAPITSPPQTLTVKNAYAYATNTAAPAVLGTISQYGIGLNGQLTALAPAMVPAGYNAFSIAINPAGTYAYVANYNKTGNGTNSTIWSYSISQATGALTQIGTITAASNPNSVTIDPQGRFVYVSNNQENNVSEYVIQGDGTLANPPGPVGVGVFGSGFGPASIAINSADTFAYVANYTDGTVSQYTINPATGSLTPFPAAVPNNTVPAGINPSYITVDPTGRYVYVANQGSSTISEYSIGADGALIDIGPGVTPYSGTTTGQSFLAINAAGTYLYAADSSSDNVAQYAITIGGANAGELALVATYTTGVGSAPYGLTIDATGKWLYVADRITAGVIHEFSISAVNGALTPLPQPTVPAGAAPTSIVTTP